MSVSLYRKYRPVRFEDVIGQGHVTRTLTNAIRQDRVSHAYLFAGPRGTGKTSTAKILAMSLNCEAGAGKATVSPDGTCPQCAAIRRGSSMDVLEIDAASNRGIDEIRDIRDRVQFAPVEGRMKVYIVDEVHMLTPEAFNALLKMLEEPPPHVVFVLATTEPHKVLPTILSRCQRFDFRRPTIPEIVTVLVDVAQRENIEVDENTLTVIARAAGGSFRDALGTLDQLSSYCAGVVTLQDALTILGVAQQDLLFELIDIVDDADAREALLFVERMTQTGTDLNQFMKDLQNHLRDLYVVQHTVDPPASIGNSQEHLDLLRAQANRMETGALIGFIELVGEAQRAVRQGADSRLELEVALLKVTRPETDTSLRAVLARLERLEAGHHSPPAGPRPGGSGGSNPSRTPIPQPPSAMKTGAPPRSTALRPVPGPPPEEADAGAYEEPPWAVPPEFAGSESRHGAEEAAAPERPPASMPGAAGENLGPPEAERPEAAHIEPSLDNLKRAWPVVLNAIKRHNKGALFAILSEGRPDSLEGDTLVVKFPRGKEFLASQVARPENSRLLSEAMLELTGVAMTVVARVAGVQAAPAESPEESARILTQQELIQALKLEFDAHPIDE